ATAALRHMHVMGVTEVGKSRFLAHLYLSLVDAGYSATLIDPHGDLAELVYAHMHARTHPHRRARVRYFDLPGAAKAGRYLKFNVLKQHEDPYVVASHILDAMHRAWPALSGGAAPMFDVLV